MRGSRLPTLISLIFGPLLALTACSGQPGGGDAPSTALDAGPAAGATAHAVPSSSAPERAAPALRADDLYGMQPLAVSGLLGSPTLLRREPPAEIWQYAGLGCTMHIFIYRDPDGAQHVVHVESVDRRGVALTNAACLTKLRQRREDGLKQG